MGILNSIIMYYLAPNYLPLGSVLIDFKWKNLSYIVRHIKFASPMCGANFSFIFHLKDFKGIGPTSDFVLLPVLYTVIEASGVQSAMQSCSETGEVGNAGF